MKKKQEIRRGSTILVHTCGIEEYGESGRGGGEESDIMPDLYADY